MVGHWDDARGSFAVTVIGDCINGQGCIKVGFAGMGGSDFDSRVRLVLCNSYVLLPLESVRVSLQRYGLDR